MVNFVGKTLAQLGAKPNSDIRLVEDGSKQCLVLQKEQASPFSEIVNENCQDKLRSTCPSLFNIGPRRCNSSLFTEYQRYYQRTCYSNKLQTFLEVARDPPCDDWIDLKTVVDRVSGAPWLYTKSNIKLWISGRYQCEEMGKPSSAPTTPMGSEIAQWQSAGFHHSNTKEGQR